MKKIFAVALVLLPFVGMSQDLKTVKKNVSTSLTEKYTVSKQSNDKEGLYLVLDANGLPLARGIFKDNKRQGVWAFFDQSTNVVQRYDYTNSKLVYLSPKASDVVKTDYVVDAPEGAKINPPVKIGGETLGILTFFNARDLPSDIAKTKDGMYITYNIQVSETGKIGDVYAQYITADGAKRQQKVYYNENFNLLDCVPAKADGIPVKSTLMLSALFNADKKDRLSAYIANSQVPGGLPIPATVGTRVSSGMSSGVHGGRF